MEIGYNKILTVAPSCHRRSVTAQKPHSHLPLSTSNDHSQGPSAPRALALQARTAIGGQDSAQARAASKESPRGRTSLGIVAPF